MSLTLVTAPTSEPVSLNEAKAHCRVEETADDALLSGLIAAARNHAEAFCRRALITQTWTLTLDVFPPSVITVPLPPLQSVSSVKYDDTAGTEQTWAASNYVVDTDAEPGRIAPAYGVSYPTLRGELGDVRVQFVAGYGDAADVPAAIRQAVLLMVGAWYEFREQLVDQTVLEIPLGAKALLWSYRMLMV